MAGEGKRAPAEGAMDSDMPTQPIDKKSRLGELRLAWGPAKQGEGTCATVAPGEEKVEPGAFLLADGGRRGRRCPRGLRESATVLRGRG